MRAATACAFSASSCPKVDRIELVGHDAAQVVLERQLVDDGQRVAGVAEDFERAAIGARRRSRAARAGGSMRTRAPAGSTTIDVIVELDGHAVLQVGLLQRAPPAAGSIASDVANVADRVLRCSTVNAAADRIVTVAAFCDRGRSGRSAPPPAARRGPGAGPPR